MEQERMEERQIATRQQFLITSHIHAFIRIIKYCITLSIFVQNVVLLFANLSYYIQRKLVEDYNLIEMPIK